MNYFIADLHLFSKNQTKQGVNYDNRPFENTDEMHQYILEHWNARVTNADSCYIIGDVSLHGRSEALISLVAQLKGHKILIKGNHDSIEDYRYRQLFEEIVDYKEISENFCGKHFKLFLSHYPILYWKDQHRGTILLYGHTHNSAEETFFQKCLTELNASEELSLRRSGSHKIQAINVGCMMPYMNYEPRTFQEIMEFKGDL